MPAINDQSIQDIIQKAKDKAKWKQRVSELKPSQPSTVSQPQSPAYELGKAAALAQQKPESDIKDKDGKRKVRPQEPGRPPEVMDGKDKRDIFNFPGLKRVNHGQRATNGKDSS